MHKTAGLLTVRSPRQRLPNNRTQTNNRLTSLARMLKKRPEMKDHFIEFMRKIFENEQTEIAPPLQADEEFWYLPIFGLFHPQKPGQ